MQKITLLTIGKMKEPWAREAAELYIQRLRPQVSLTVLELAPSRGKEGPAQQAEESDRLLKMLESMQGELWVLDETGKGVTSVDFAGAIGRAKDAGAHIIFLLGGAYGFTDAVRKKAQRIVKLSDMTLPHELCRVLFLEQLYRACEINKGSGYHHV
jgi:23S rRNA (pseudouridine1915-N3)-methyltransferase